MMKRLASSVLLIAVFTSVLVRPTVAAEPQRAAPPAYQAMYVFGDSLADTGNDFLVTSILGVVPAIPPSTRPNRTYYKGRFSNGPIGFEYLWALLNRQPVSSIDGVTPSLAVPFLPKRGAVSFAFGGSTTGYLTSISGSALPLPGLKGQVELLKLALQGKRAPNRALYAIFSGANDYLVDPPNLPADPAEVVANIVQAVTRLYTLGARDVMVLNLPDLGVLPLTVGSQQSALFSGIAQAHNALLAEALMGLAARLPGIHLIPADVNAVLQALPSSAILSTPALDTFFPPPGPGQLPVSVCLFTNPQSCPSVPTFAVDPAFVFWDAEHPTTAVHRLLGQYLFSVLEDR